MSGCQKIRRELDTVDLKLFLNALKKNLSSVFRSVEARILTADSEMTGEEKEKFTFMQMVNNAYFLGYPQQKESDLPQRDLSKVVGQDVLTSDVLIGCYSSMSDATLRRKLCQKWSNSEDCTESTLSHQYTKKERMTRVGCNPLSGYFQHSGGPREKEVLQLVLQKQSKPVPLLSMIRTVLALQHAQKEISVALNFVYEQHSDQTTANVYFNLRGIPREYAFCYNEVEGMLGRLEQTMSISNGTYKFYFQICKNITTVN